MTIPPLPWHYRISSTPNSPHVVLYDASDDIIGILRDGQLGDYVCGLPTKIDELVAEHEKELADQEHESYYEIRDLERDNTKLEARIKDLEGEVKDLKTKLKQFDAN